MPSLPYHRHQTGNSEYERGVWARRNHYKHRHRHTLNGDLHRPQKRQRFDDDNNLIVGRMGLAIPHTEIIRAAPSSKLVS